MIEPVMTRQLMIRLLGVLEPVNHNSNSTMYDVGYEQAKQDILRVLSEAFNKDYNVPLTTKLIKELRNGS